ncbi:hypothetical protein [Bradyrhizobium ganzhouense]|uniref:hypothetical protein n=1 Tax=Bradyrhizobium ganzhouense TaxID=1179767 RepID=UPI003CF6CA54
MMMTPGSKATDRRSNLTIGFLMALQTAVRRWRTAYSIWQTRRMTIKDSKSLRRSCDDAAAQASDMAECLQSLFPGGF